jgi:hypothetical protein
MTNPMKLSKKQYGKLVAAAFPEYHGRKVKLVFAAQVTFYDTNWDGGTVNKYVAVASDGRTAKLNAPAPWCNPIEGQTFEMPVDAMLLERSYFCGQDGGITIYAHPSHLPKWLEAPKEA